MAAIATENEQLRQEVLSKTQQVKQYKKQVDQYKQKVEVLKCQIEIQIQQVEAFAKEAEEWQSNYNAERSRGESLERRIVELENSQLHQCNGVNHADLEGHNTELLKERDKKAETEKAKKEAEKVKKETKKKLSDKGATSPEPTGVSMALEKKLAQNEQLYETLRNENDDLRDELNAFRTANMSLKEMLTHVPQTLPLPQSCKSPEPLMTPPAVDLCGATLTGHQSTLVQQLEEKDKLLQEARDEQLQLRQQTDQIMQNLKGENKLLRQKLGGQTEKLQAQQTHQSEFWEVSREEVDLDMQKFLGTGAWGFVVEGTFRGQQVAVKRMHDMIQSPEFVEVIRKEIAIMAQVRHPNLVLLIAAVMDAENDPLIVTELLDISLRKAYEKKRLQGSSKLSIFRDIAAALNYLHLHQSGEIIHRDVSSANVLLEAKPNNQWKAKLSDFGSAKLAIEAKSTAPGAPVYSAPEVRKEMGIRQTAKLDVYSYGILLCEVTVEQFPGEKSLPSMMQVVRCKWAFIHCLISSCIQSHPDRRPTMSYVLSELNKLQS